MKYIFSFFIIFFLFGCTQKEITLPHYPKTPLVKSEKKVLDDYDAVLALFLQNCQVRAGQKLYAELCKEAQHVSDAKKFFDENFTLYEVAPKQKRSLLTGYYEAALHGSLKQTKQYKYPIYSVPDDLVTVELSSIYPELKRYRLRGRIVGKKLVPYYSRAEEAKIKAEPLCYVDDKIERFFLEVQGSGRILLDDNTTMFVGYKDQNGHRYRSIGRYMIKKGYISKENVSLQTIEAFLKTHLDKQDEILNYNPSLVFFQQKDHGASGALGLELVAKRSVAVDPSKVPLGSMLFIEAPQIAFGRTVFAWDVGGAIKGEKRADLFLGYGEAAKKIAGELKSPLRMWIYLPKREDAKNR